MPRAGSSSGRKTSGSFSPRARYAASAPLTRITLRARHAHQARAGHFSSAPYGFAGSVAASITRLRLVGLVAKIAQQIDRPRAPRTAWRRSRRRSSRAAPSRFLQSLSAPDRSRRSRRRSTPPPPPRAPPRRSARGAAARSHSRARCGVAVRRGNERPAALRRRRSEAARAERPRRGATTSAGVYARRAWKVSFVRRPSRPDPTARRRGRWQSRRRPLRSARKRRRHASRR